MKLQIFKYIIPALFLLNACQETEVDKLFDETPEGRTSEEIATVKNDLIASEHGWLAEYYYKDSTMHTTLVFDFKEDDRVIIKSVFEDYLEKESSYKMKYAQQFDLTFDSYSVLAYLMDETHYADFRWELESAAENEYKFISRSDKSEGISYLTLKKGDETTNTHIEAQRVIHSIRQKLIHDFEKAFFRNLITNAGIDKYRFSFNQFSDEVTIQSNINDVETSFTTKVNITRDGKVTFIKPFIDGSSQIKQLKYNAEQDNFIITDGIDGFLGYEHKPAFPYKGAVTSFLSFNEYVIRRQSPIIMNSWNTLMESIPSLNQHNFKIGPKPILFFNSNKGWAGFEMHQPIITGEDHLQYNFALLVYGDWWRDIYFNDAGKNLINIFSDPSGYYIVPNNENSFYLVNSSNSLVYYYLEALPGI